MKSASTGVSLSVRENWLKTPKGLLNNSNRLMAWHRVYVDKRGKIAPPTLLYKVLKKLKLSANYLDNLRIEDNYIC